MAGRIRIPRLVKPVAAVMAVSGESIERCLERLAAELGPVDLLGEAYRFDEFSGYYGAEMGPELTKVLAAFGPLRKPGFLAPFKRRTAACERADRPHGGGRRVNVDPGYWGDAKLVLASTKNYSHRVWIGRRVFAEVTLRFHQGRMQPLEWTYPDYRSAAGIEFFERVRKKYLQQISEIDS